MLEKITEKDLQKVKNAYIEKYGIETYLQKFEIVNNEEDLVLELLNLIEEIRSKEAELELEKD